MGSSSRHFRAGLSLAAASRLVSVLFHPWCAAGGRPPDSRRDGGATLVVGAMEITRTV